MRTDHSFECPNHRCRDIPVRKVPNLRPYNITSGFPQIIEVGIADDYHRRGAVAIKVRERRSRGGRTGESEGSPTHSKGIPSMNLNKNKNTKAKARGALSKLVLQDRVSSAPGGDITSQTTIEFWRQQSHRKTGRRVSFSSISIEHYNILQDTIRAPKQDWPNSGRSF